MDWEMEKDLQAVEAEQALTEHQALICKMRLTCRAVTFSEWNEETFVYGHFAMVVPTRHAIFPNAWEHFVVRKDKHHF